MIDFSRMIIFSKRKVELNFRANRFKLVKKTIFSKFPETLTFLKRVL